MFRSYEKVSLTDIIRLEKRPVKVEADEYYQEIGIYSFGRGIFHKTPRTGLEVGDKDLYQIKNGDFIFQITFAWEGAVGLASTEEDGMFGSSRFPTFRVDESRCFPKFLFHYFRTNAGRVQLSNISPGSAGRNRVLSLKRLHEIQIALPPLEEQQRIVARIEELAAKIAEAQALRREALAASEKFIDMALETIINKNIENSNWLFQPLSSIAQINPTREKLEAIPDKVTFVPMAAIDAATGTVKNAEIKSFIEVSKGYTFFKENDVLFAKITPCMENGKAAIASNLLGAIGFGSTEYHVLRPETTKITSRWLHLLVRQQSFRKDAREHFNGSAGQQRVPQKFLEGKILPVPPLEEQEQIVKYLDGLQAKVEAVKQLQAATQAELDALLPAVLDKAFKGELL